MKPITEFKSRKFQPIEGGNMEHLGDITRINGAAIEPVNCITFGSPCQDLSVAGNRAGLAGKRSGLFMEAIRIIKEMREKTNGEYPRFAIWENVPGAFSSNKGEDFRAVLEEFANIKERNAAIPRPPQGKWRTSGAIVGTGWSLAWRVHDAQFWGVTQRRRRIALVADFTGGGIASEILFEREGLRGDFAQGEEPRQGAAARVEGSTDGAVYGMNIMKGVGEYIIDEDLTPTLISGKQMQVVQLEKPISTGKGNVHAVCLQGNGIDRCDTAGCNGKGWKYDTSYTLNTVDRHGVCVAGFDWTGGNTAGASLGASPTTSTTVMSCKRATVLDGRGNGDGETAPAITGDHNRTISDYTALIQEPCAYSFDSMSSNSMKSSNPISGCRKVDIARTIDTSDQNPAKNQGGICVYKEHGFASYNDGVGTIRSEGGTMGGGSESLVVGTLCAHDARGVDQQAAEQNKLVPCNQTVRRLTPLECERLQGYPDYYTDIGDWVDTKGKKRKCSDAARYKALGNSIALPFWAWLFEQMQPHLPEAPTLGSLFDGIGGFPLAWERLHGKGTARWASEIEEFTIAVTKRHFT